MYKVLRDLVRGKRALILGFGREGRSTYRVLKDMSDVADLVIADQKYSQPKPQGIELIEGDNYLDRLDDFDVVFKSPGVVLPRPITSYKCLISSQTDVFLSAYKQRVIGVTGTKGKSTVSTMLYHVLAASNEDRLLAGNIGVPVFDIADDVHEQTVVVLELSCHQLEYCTQSPHLAILLNVFEDHLDRYLTLERYQNTKKHIYMHQDPSDVLLFDGVTALDKRIVSQKVAVDVQVLPENTAETLSKIGAVGEHNLKNCAFVYEAARRQGLADEQFIAMLKTYRPLPHRLQLIGSLDGVDYYDDSISTTVESTISAMSSIKNVGTVLVGGMDRGIDYAPLIKQIAATPSIDVILMYESGRRIFSEIRARAYKSDNVYLADDLACAVALAKDLTAAGRACILSPASASYTDFSNFEERGDAFKQLVFEPQFGA